MNDYIKPDEKIDIPILEIGRDVEDYQNKKIASLRQSRDSENIRNALLNIEKSCRGNNNLLPSIIESVKIGATLGEIVISMKKVFGEWNETSVF